MLSLLGTSTISVIGVIGILAAFVSVITEVLKGIIPKCFPTKLLVLIISLIVTIFAIVLFCDINIKMIIAGVIGSFVVSFVSMFGFDSLKSIFERFRVNNTGDDK